MKTLAEVQEWCLGAQEIFGDASEPIGQIFARYVALIPPESDDILVSWQDGKLALILPMAGWIPQEIDTQGPRGDEETGLEAFGIENICPGLWTLMPSLNIPRLIHVFVHIYDVTTPAPWEQRIIAVGGF